MSKNFPHDNMYSILAKLDALKPTPQEKHDATVKQIRESVESQGSILKGLRNVTPLEKQLSEKYMGFKAVEKSAKASGAENPAAVAAAAGRKKYGKKAFQKAAAAGKKMGEDYASMGSGYGTTGGVVGEEQCDECGLYESECECDHLHEDPMGDIEGGTVAEAGKVEKTKTGLRHTKTDYSGYVTDEPEEKKSDDVGKIATKSRGRPRKASTVNPRRDPNAPKKGRGRPKAEKSTSGSTGKTAKFNDPFGRVPDKAPRGKKGTVVKGKAQSKPVDEVITKKTPAGEIIKDFQKSKNPKFAGKSQAQRKKQALGAYYGMHPEKSKVKESRRIFESVNFKRMMDEANMTLDEMLECINQDIQTYKNTGDMTDRLRDFMHLHNHAKKQMEEAGPVPYEIPAVQRKAAGAAPLTPKDVQAQDAARSMHPGMTKLDAPEPAGIDDGLSKELDELAQLAGLSGGKEIEDEGNEFTGALANARAHHDNTFDVDGKEFTVREAQELVAMLKVAGMDSTKLEEALAKNEASYGDTEVDEPTEDGEEPVNKPDEKYFSMKASTMGPGEGDPGEKQMNPDRPTYKNGDNAMARPPVRESSYKLEAKLQAEYNSIKKAK